MPSLPELIATAVADVDGSAPAGTARRAHAHAADARAGSGVQNEAEVARIMQICNACRYCEGFCAVFPAMTRRLSFEHADIHYLANLCHNCGACLHACQYAPPHEFMVNVPQAMARVRVQTYQDYAWPAAFGSLYRRAGTTVALSLAFGVAAFLALAVALTGSLASAPAGGDPAAGAGGNFYAIFPHNLLAALFGVVFLYVIVALAIGVRRFWREVAPGVDPAAQAGGLPALPPGVRAPATAEAVHDVLRLKYLEGGHGLGCNDEDDRFTLRRRTFHHLTFYGFMLCFAATCVATLYHYLLDLHAPYALTSAPVVLGTLGGIGLLIGPAGLLWLNVRRDPAHGDVAQRPMDRGFIVLLWLTAFSGLALLAWRDTAAMAWLLAVHLGIVMALFVTLPYGKFAHGVFRSAALLMYAIEKRLPSRLKLGAD